MAVTLLEVASRPKTSLPGRVASWIRTAAAGRAGYSTSATSSCAAMKSPRSKPGHESAPRCRPTVSGSGTSTNDAVRALLPRRVGRTRRQAVRSLRLERWDRSGRRAGRAVHKGGDLQQGAARVRDRRQPASAHRGKESIDRLRGAWKNLILAYTPVHASWLNQAEIYFSVTQREVLTPTHSPGPRSTRSSSTHARPGAARTNRDHLSGSPPAPTSTASPTSSTYPAPKQPDPTNTSPNFGLRGQDISFAPLSRLATFRDGTLFCYAALRRGSWEYFLAVCSVR